MTTASPNSDHVDGLHDRIKQVDIQTHEHDPVAILSRIGGRMSIRQQIISALGNEALTADEIGRAINRPHDKLKHNLGEMVRVGLLKRVRDDATGMPAYRALASTVDLPARKTKQKQGEIPLNESCSEAIQDEDAPPPANPDWLASANRMLNQRLKEIALAVVGHEGGNDGELVSKAIAMATRLEETERKLADAIKGREHDQALLIDLLARLEAIAHALRGAGLPDLANVQAGDGNLPVKVVALTGAYQQAIDQIHSLTSLAAAQPNPGAGLQPLFYASFLAYSDPIATLDEAKARAEEMLHETGERTCVAAIVATAELAVKWKEAA
jgi:DNA-binding HxlR family transcriptional regulator